MTHISSHGEQETHSAFCTIKQENIKEKHKKHTEQRKEKKRRKGNLRNGKLGRKELWVAKRGFRRAVAMNLTVKSVLDFFGVSL